MTDYVNQFNDFLSRIDLVALRDKYKDIKIVELDMPKDVQALRCIYLEYWDKRKAWLEYEDFYEVYKQSLQSELESWRKKCQFSKETFYRGLPARIYRTWASLLTQIQGAYVAEKIHGKGKVAMGVDIDQSGKDIVIEFSKGMRLPVQIKKISARRDMPRGTPRYKYIELRYAVPTSGPKTKTGKESKPYKDWEKEWSDKLTRLDNGFVIFKPAMFTVENLLAGIIEGKQ